MEMRQDNTTRSQAQKAALITIKHQKLSMHQIKVEVETRQG